MNGYTGIEGADVGRASVGTIDTEGASDGVRVGGPDGLRVGRGDGRAVIVGKDVGFSDGAEVLGA